MSQQTSFLNAPTSKDRSKPCAHIVDGDQRVDQVVPTRESDQTRLKRSLSSLLVHPR